MIIIILQNGYVRLKRLSLRSFWYKFHPKQLYIEGDNQHFDDSCNTICQGLQSSHIGFPFDLLI